MSNKLKIIGGGLAIGAGVGGVGLLLNALERASNKRALEAEKKRKTTIVYLPKKEASIKVDKPETKSIKRTHKKGLRDIRGKFSKTPKSEIDKKASESSLSMAGGMLAGLGAGVGGYILVNKLGKEIRKKKLSQQIRDKRKEYINKVLLKKEAEGAISSAGRLIANSRYRW